MRALHRGAGIVAFLGGTFGLYYGFVMTFLVPGNPGGSFFEKSRMLLGVLPLVAAVLALCLAGWLLFRSLSRKRLSLSDVIALCIGAAAGIIFVFFILAGVYSHARGY